MLSFNKIDTIKTPRPFSGGSPGSTAGHRLRRHIMTVGVAGLSDRDLLAVVLGGGAHGSAFALADRVMDVAPGVSKLVGLHPAVLNQVPGLGAGLTARLLSALELGSRAILEVPRTGIRVSKPEDVHPLLRRFFRGLDRERFVALYLDTRHRILATETVSIGTLNVSVVHPREVFKLAVSLSAAAVIVAHNHPSGCSQPSAEDLDLTARLDRCGKLLGISLLDHLVAGAGEITSIRELGWPTGPPD